MTGTESVHERWRATFVRYAPLILWIGVIFFLSSPQASMARTSGFVGPILRYLWPSVSDDTLYFVNFSIRKIAHFTEYSILVILAIRALSRSRTASLYKYRYIIPLVLALAIASVDELNQSFEPSRTGLASDVVLDFASACIMAAILWLNKRPRQPVTGELSSDGPK